MIGRLLFLFVFAAAGLIGYGLGSGRIQWEKSKKVETAVNIHPEREAAPTEFKSFAIVLHAYNDSLWCERALNSIFSQDYDYFRLIFVDDGSTDGTYDRVQRYVIENQQQHRTILIKNEERMGPVGSLYRAVEHCLDKEIIYASSARNWFALPTVLSRVNRAFQNPDVWLAFGQSILYPSYNLIAPPEWKLDTIANEGYGDSFLQAPCFFYSALFKQLPLLQLYHSGAFDLNRASYLIPMLELAGGRFKSLPEPFSFENQTIPHPKPAVIEHAAAAPLAQFPSPSIRNPRADILLFSFDRPLQLFAALESIDRYVAGYENLIVLYRATDDRYEAGYQQLKTAFPKVRFVRQGADPKKDFKPLVLKTLSLPSEYILFGVDDLIVKDEVDLKLCMEAMEKTKAYGFYLRCGQNIHQCYRSDKPQEAPPSIPLYSQILAWDIETGREDWNFPNNLDMTLYRKSDLKKVLQEKDFKNPTALQLGWTKGVSGKGIGLYFEQSKVVNIPLNEVGNSGNPHMNYLTAEELLVKFNQHLKMDIDPLHQIENPSPYFEYVPNFVPR